LLLLLRLLAIHYQLLLLPAVRLFDSHSYHPPPLQFDCQQANLGKEIPSVPFRKR